jgi:outer membrane protein
LTFLGLSQIAMTIAALHGQVPASGPLTIDQAVLLAERNAFAVRLQQATVEKDRQAIFLALSALGPTIGINPVYTQSSNETLVSLGAGQAPVVVSPPYTGTATGQITFPIDLSGNNTRLVWASRAQYDGAKRSLEAAFNDARLSARTAFLAVLRDQALVVVAEESLKDAQGRLNQAQLEFQQVQIAKIDVDRFDAQVAQANSDLLNAQNTLQLADYAFNLALARPIEIPVELVDVNDTPPIPADGEALAANAQQVRPEARAQVDQIRALALIRRAQEAGLDPSLSLGIGYSDSINSGAFASPASSTFSLNLNIPIFDSGATRARVKEARQDEVSAKIQLQQTQLGISQEVRNSFANLASAQARLTNAERQVTLAEEVFRLAKVRQAAGEGTYVEVIDAETSLATARNGLVSAKYDYFQGYSQLQHAVGNDRVQLQAATVAGAEAHPPTAGIK